MDHAALIGSIINHRWKLVRVLGEGGMGAVYEGEHVEIGRKVAVKLVHAAHVRDPEFVARLKREARATGMLESENIVQVLDAGEDEHSGLFIVMELLRGENLEQVLAREKRVAPTVAAMIALQAARGLARAHEQGIVHRDLKPANLVLCQREDRTPLVKLVDFGIAKLVKDASESAEGAGLTRVGSVVGTPNYMSPEQAQGLVNVDARTDVYALGVLLYEMLSGRPAVPPLPTYEQRIVHIVTKPAPRVNDEEPLVDPRLDALVSEMMARLPDDRPSDMATVIGRLTQLFSPSDLAPASFNGLHLTAAMAAISAQDGAAPPPAPSSASVVAPASALPRRTLVAQAPVPTRTPPAAPTAIAVSLDRAPPPEEGPAIPVHGPSRRLLAGVGGAAVLLVLVVSALVRSTPDRQSGLVAVTSSGSPPSAVSRAASSAAPALVIEPLAPLAITSALPTPSAESAGALVPARSSPPKASGGSDAGRTSEAPAPRETRDGGPRTFGGAGLANEF